MATESNRGTISRLLTENPGWKLLSLAAAVALWIVFAGETEIATSIPVNVQYRQVPPDLEISSDHLDHLFLKVRGPAARLSAHGLSQTTLTLDLHDLHAPGEQTFTINQSNLDLPAGISLVRAVPSQIRIAVERRITKDVPITARFSGSAPQGYRIGRYQVAPDRIRVTGPESRVRNITAAETDAIDLSSTVSNQQFRAAAYLPDPQVQFEGAPPNVLVRVFLEKIP